MNKDPLFELPTPIGKYTIYGGINGEVATRFLGDLHILGDKKVVGAIRDCRTQHVRRIILGLQRGEILSFFKISPDGSSQIYNCEGFKTGVYTGRYRSLEEMIFLAERYQRPVDAFNVSSGILKNIPEIQEAFACEDENEVLEILSKVDVEKLEESLNSIVIAEVNIFGMSSSFSLKEI